MIKNVVLFIVSCSALIALFATKHTTVAYGDLASYKNTAAHFRAYISGETPKLETVYPVLAISYLLVIAENPFGIAFHIMWSIALLCLSCVTLVMTLWLFEGRHIRWLFPSIALTAIIVGPGTLFEGFDVLIMLLLFLMIASFEAKSFVWTGFFLTTAISLKTSPVFLVPLVYFACSGNREKMSIGIIAGITISIAIVMIIGGTSAFLDGTLSHLKAMHLYGIDLMSSLSAFDMLIHGIIGEKIPIWKIPSDPLPSWNANFPHSTKSILLLTIALLCTALPLLTDIAKLKNHRFFFAATCTLLLIVLTLSPVFTPRYLFWVMPLIIIWLCEEYETTKKWKPLLPIIIAVVIAGVTTQWIFPSHWMLLQYTQPLYGAIIHNLRTASLIALIFLLWKYFPNSHTKDLKKHSTLQ